MEMPVEVESHPAFPEFIRWVETGNVVRSDLLDGGNRRSDWVIIWQTWFAGYDAGNGKKQARRPLSVKKPLDWSQTPFGRMYSSLNGSS